ncbi:hypothetical protein IDH44_03390 [Paenibacillus sp. IB182496]|uniref:TolB protein n=1 Tax=Paenibacillus sabuli TaxID=2772509 RepID=A0A927BQS9_9BACL|nr:hypothetical protein [Paenibacillus sabuli]MBD2844221.1 hypothetical protein [Paenibacillus sabuli]
MKKHPLQMAALSAALLLTLGACASNNEPGRVTDEDPEGDITVIENQDEEVGEPVVSIEKIDELEQVQITDWLDDNTAIVSKANTELDKMELAELADQYPRSLYYYHVDTDEYELIQAEENAFLGSAELSPDNTHLLYTISSLGDPVFSVLNLETMEGFDLTGDPIGGAMSASWADNETIVGASYAGGAYVATVSGELGPMEHLDEGALYLVQQSGDRVYYNTNSEPGLQALDTQSGESTALPFDNAGGIYPSPDGNQLLVAQYNDSKMSLILSDTAGSDPRTIAEGASIAGVSWSPDQSMAAYILQEEEGSQAGRSLYVYDLLSDDTTQIAVNLEQAFTSWSPSNEKLAFVEWGEESYSSSIVYLNYALQGGSDAQTP